MHTACEANTGTRVLYIIGMGACSFGMLGPYAYP